MHSKTARPEPHSVAKENFLGSSSSKQTNKQTKQTNKKWYKAMQ